MFLSAPLQRCARRALPATAERSLHPPPGPSPHSRRLAAIHGPRRAAAAAAASAAVAPPPAAEDARPAADDARPALLPESLTPSQRKFLESALRVNHAGELAATLIYASQTPVLLRRHPQLREVMAHMSSQEAGHLRTFTRLLARYRIRPTLLYPVWSVAATALGWTTGLLGREAAMACTEAVETEIGDHYNRQVGELLRWECEMEAVGGTVSAEMSELVNVLRRVRDEELEHLDTAVEHDSKMAKPYELLTGVIRAGCRGAIWVSERI